VFHRTISRPTYSYTLSLHDALPISLVIRSVGFTTQEIQAGDGLQPLVVHFSPSATTLNETVILGYTAVKRKDLTGSVSTVGAEKIGRAHSELQSRENLVCRLLLEKK